MAQTTNTVEVKMKFSADASQGSKAMKDLQQHARGVSAAVDDANRKMKGMGAGGGDTGTANPKDAGAPPRDAANSFMAGLAKATAVLMLFKKAVEGAAVGVEAYYGGKYSNKTGGAIAETLNEAMFGTPKWAIEKFNNIRYAKSAAETKAGYEQEDRYNVTMNARAGIQQHARGFAEQRAYTGDAFEASMVGAHNMRYLAGRYGTEQGQIDPRFKDPIEQQRMSTLGVGMSSRAYGRSDAEFRRADEALRDAENRAAAVRRRQVNSATSAPSPRYSEADYKKMGPIMERVMRPTEGSEALKNNFAQLQKETDLRKANLDVMLRQKELQQAIEGRHKAGLDLEEKRSQLRKANLAYSKAELDILKEKESKAKSQAAEFGMMGASDKLALRYALQQSQSQGFDTLPEEMRNLLARSGLTGDYARKQAEKSTDNDPVYQGLIQALGGKTAAQATKDRITVENKIELDTAIDAEELAKGIWIQWSQFFSKMEPLVEQIAMKQLNMVLNQRKQLDK